MVCCTKPILSIYLCFLMVIILVGFKMGKTNDVGLDTAVVAHGYGNIFRVGVFDRADNGIFFRPILPPFMVINGKLKRFFNSSVCLYGLKVSASPMCRWFVWLYSVPSGDSLSESWGERIGGDIG